MRWPDDHPAVDDLILLPQGAAAFASEGLEATRLRLAVGQDPIRGTRLPFDDFSSFRFVAHPKSNPILWTRNEMEGRGRPAIHATGVRLVQIDPRPLALPFPPDRVGP